MKMENGEIGASNGMQQDMLFSIFHFTLSIFHFNLIIQNLIKLNIWFCTNRVYPFKFFSCKSEVVECLEIVFELSNT